MAVTVHYLPVNTGQSETEHETGKEFDVRDGHLHVSDEKGDDVAVYAPGSWKSAVTSS